MFGQSQKDAELFKRIQALSINGYDYYNIDGVTISCQVTNIPFSKRQISKSLKIDESQLLHSVDYISQKNLFFEKSDTICDNIIQYNYNIVIEDENGYITHILYMSFNKQCYELQRILTPIIVSKQIPESVFNKANVFNTINFAGREVDLNTYTCEWRNVNSLQCRYHGQMSWSVHKDSLDAVQSLELKQYITAHCKYDNVKVLADEDIDILVEEQDLVARRITYDASRIFINRGNVNTKSLIIYYFVVPARGNFVSCVLSHWNNDIIEEDTKLPSLLEKIIQLK
jgi:hypothetical protein